MRRASFLVRIWWDDTCDPRGLRGEVEHVHTGQTRRFCGEEELLDILRTWARASRSARLEEPEDGSPPSFPPEAPPEGATWKW